MKKLILVSLIAPLFYGDILAQPVPDAVVIPQNTRFGQRFIPERRSSDRTPSQSGTGAIWFNTTEQQWKGDTGVSIVPIGQGGGGGGSQPGPQSPNTVQAGPVSGGAANPTFRALVAADIPSLDASKIATGLIPTARGGTGIGNFAVGDLLYANSTSTLARLAIGGSNQCLIVSGGLPIWSACPGAGGGSGITSLNGLTGSTQTFTNDINVTITSGGTSHVLSWAGTLSATRGGTGGNTTQAAINNLSQLTTSGDLLYHNGINSTRLARGVTGQCLVATATTIQWQACLSGGSVSSVSSDNFSPLFNVSISNATSTPNFSYSAISQNQNLVYASPSGSAGIPTFRALVALDVPNLDASKITSGTFVAGRIPNLSSIATGLTVNRCMRVNSSGFPEAHSVDCIGVSGSATTNTVTKFTGTNTIGNSSITDDGTNVGIGTGLIGIVNAGTFKINGTTSGVISLLGAAAAGTYNFIFPTTAGTNGQCLISAGGASPNTWGTCGSGGSSAFSAITSGTNTSAAMIVSSGASLTYSGSGTIDATTIGGNAVAKAHWNKTIAPATSDNTSSGHGDADMWGDTTNNNVYIKLEEAAGSASWLRFLIAGAAAGTPSSITLTNATGLPTSAQAADAKVRTCEMVYGSRVSGASAIPSDDDVPDVCSNLTGSTMTIVSVECKANTGDMTVTPIVSGGSATSILSGALTCGNGSFASGTLNGTPTQSNGVTLDFNVTAGGTATYAVLRIKRTL